ncbi:hypothetical protein GCM10010319_24260 [Streptomyces blastmyceticus]|uniref:Uncharacterized protein n=2 Tax=Streptomyces blastmyceticus TaxID=68180 RepID=A0ABN0WU87_9ACTN
MSQRDLALSIDKSESWVGQVERGVLPLDSLATAETVAGALGMASVFMLALDKRWPQTDIRGGQGVEQLGPVERRTFMRGAVAVPLAGKLAAVEPGRIAYAAKTTAVDPATAQQLGMVSAAYRRGYQTMPAPALLNAARSHFQLLASLQPERQSGEVQQGLLSQMGQMAALAGAVAFLDLGAREDGKACTATGLQLAKASGDQDLFALCWAGRAFQTAYEGDCEGGMDCSLAAVDHAKGASARMRAWCAAVASEMHASTGDEKNCREFLDNAREHINSPMDDDRWRGIGWFDAAKLDAYEGGDLVRLGQHETALARLATALAHLDPSMRRHRATAHADRADAYTTAGHPEAAIDDAHTSLALLEQVHHDETLRRITVVHARLRPMRLPGTRSLTEHLTDVRHSMETACRSTAWA